MRDSAPMVASPPRENSLVVSFSPTRMMMSVKTIPCKEVSSERSSAR